MDSAFLHARNLFNFFAEAKPRFDISIVEFGPPAPYSSTIYDTWKEPLNRHALHISKGRSHPSNLKAGVHLKNQVQVFASENLELWRRFEEDAAAINYAAALTDARERAIAHAANDAAGRIAPLFT